MKVGIMTMQRIKNYGSFLQAYGLKKCIEGLGGKVEFVDYRFEGALVNEREGFLKKIWKNKNIFSLVRKKCVHKQYQEAFERSFIPELCGEEENYLPGNLDSLVIGSDEVFNCLQPYPVGYSKELFGNGFEDVSLYSYAASFGQVGVKGLRKVGIDREIAGMLSKFSEVSVRDANSFNVVKALTRKEPLLHLDPVLVTDYSEEMIDNVKLKNYIVLYAYPERLSKKELKEIKRFAKRHHKKIVGFGMYQKICDINIVVHPFEIFSYFKYADFVITDTFHGSIFAIKTHTNFCSIVRETEEGNSNKLEDLLTRLSLKNRIISNIALLDKMYEEDVNFAETDEIIKNETAKTEGYLKKIISGGGQHD